MHLFLPYGISIEFNKFLSAYIISFRLSTTIRLDDL
ncbi:unnamed protein product [Brugia timori]|uniref:Uncharacterized protein n=1 Tax=Brugia timori TaxID=42155 RepID=A0A0R3R8Y2_9BILA|nr:unnamed protein product [Brugia timori]